jgi:hypothetical protein
VDLLLIFTCILGVAKVFPRLLVLVYSSEEILEIWQDATVDDKEGMLHVFVTFPVGPSLAIQPQQSVDPIGSKAAHIKDPRALAEEDCEVQAFCFHTTVAAELRKVLPFWLQR